MNVLITGSSSGLGYGLTKYYLEKGNKVFGVSRSLNEELKTFENYEFLVQDVSHFSEIETNFASFLNGCKKMDLVILNAGMLSEIKDLKDTGLDEIKQVMNVNVWANKIIIDTLFRQLKTIKQVVAVSSGASVSGARGWNAYSLSKATLNMLINLYASEKPNTHFCALAPGLVHTQMQDYIYNLEEEDKYPVIKKLKAARGTSRMPKPDEAARVVAEGIEKALNYESGQYLDVRQM